MRGSLAPVGVALAAIGCCAAAPVVAGAVGGITLGAGLGVGALVVAAVALAVMAVARRNRASSIDRPDELER